MGAFIGMEIFGFSINQLTLFGMVLAIGIVVDDAIVVIESVERIMREEHLPPKEATRKAMDADHQPDHRDLAWCSRRCSFRARCSRARWA